MKYNVTIGLEMHCEISETKTKAFSGAKNSFTDLPNENISPIDMGFPGILPVVNKEAVKKSIILSKVLNCRVPEYLYFERKNYYYPDLPKGYQITQNTFPAPIGQNGVLEVYKEDGSTFKVLINNLHLEEDSASMTHFYDISTIDYNRAGVPLLELVTEPCIHSSSDAVAFLENMRDIYRYLDISEADSKKGQIRCDVNISLSRDDSLGTKVEVKNVNSFSAVKDVIEYEIKRQSELLDQNKDEEIIQETRRYDETTLTTVHMRSKVDAIDYKYFVEPNIPKIKITEDFINEAIKDLPMLPNERKNRYINEFNLSYYDANNIVKEKGISDYFEECIKLDINPKVAANWLTVNILGYLNKSGEDILDINLKPKMLKEIITKLDSGAISSKQAKEIVTKVLEENADLNSLLSESNQISDEAYLLEIIKRIIKENETQVNEYKNGKTNLFQYFVGNVMKETKGKANPSLTSELIKKELEK